MIRRSIFFAGEGAQRKKTLLYFTLPRYYLVEGNETADRLTGEGAESKISGL